MTCRPAFSGLFITGLALATLILSAERCTVNDPTETPLNVRRFDGKVIGSGAAPPFFYA